MQGPEAGAVIPGAELTERDKADLVTLHGSEASPATLLSPNTIDLSGSSATQESSDQQEADARLKLANVQSAAGMGLTTDGLPPHVTST